MADPHPDPHAIRFLVLDGGEGCGKSTQAARLKAFFEREGRPVELLRDPGSTRIGEKVRDILLNSDHVEMTRRCECMLYMAARAQMVAEQIRPALDEGKLVICDRYVSSTLAYQVGDDLGADDIRAAADVAIGDCVPDLTLLLDLDPAVGIARVTRPKDRIEQRPLAYHQQVRARFRAQAEDNPKFKIINADQPEDDVEHEIQQALGINAAPLFE
ncbi:MAG: dTMP kinase [Planctomycetota bacterium]